MALLSRLRDGLSRSTLKLSGGISSVFTKRRLDDEALEELEELLISADLGTAVAAKVIAATGNYGEIFERNLGSQSALDLARGLNAQWNARPAGLIYGLPIR